MRIRNDNDGRKIRKKYMIRSFLEKILQTSYVRSAMAEKADLGAFKERPTPRIVFGLFLIGFSYAIGWPAVSALGMLSVYYREPLLVGIGGPAIYGFSHLVFLAGMYVAGAKYTAIFLKWATRMFMEKMMGSPLEIPVAPVPPATPVASGSRTSEDKTG